MVLLVLDSAIRMMQIRTVDSRDVVCFVEHCSCAKDPAVVTGSTAGVLAQVTV